MTARRIARTLRSLDLALRNVRTAVAREALAWTRQSGSAEPSSAGARLTFDIEIQPTASEIAAAGLAVRDVQPLVWTDASVRLEGPQFDAVEAPVALALGMVAAVTVDLSSLAAGILAPLLQSDAVSPLQVTWSGHVQMRLPPVEVIATADVERCAAASTSSNPTGV